MIGLVVKREVKINRMGWRKFGFGEGLADSRSPGGRIRVNIKQISMADCWFSRKCLDFIYSVLTPVTLDDMWTKQCKERMGSTNPGYSFLRCLDPEQRFETSRIRFLLAQEYSKNHRPSSMSPKQAVCREFG